MAPNAVTLAQSMFEKGSDVFGIFDGDTPVGMIAFKDLSHPEAYIGEGDNPDGIYLWRLLIDGAHQGRGHGWAALTFTMERARRLGRAEVTLTAVPEEGTPIPFYEKFGFIQTGRILDDEVELALAVT